MEELSERRRQVTQVEEHKRNERDSLHSANAQVAALRAQLEQAVDAKVNKKMGSKLKVSPDLVRFSQGIATDLVVFLISGPGVPLL